MLTGAERDHGQNPAVTHELNSLKPRAQLALNFVDPHPSENAEPLLGFEVRMLNVY